MSAQIAGRCPGGTVVVNEERAALYYGNQVKDSNEYDNEENDTEMDD